MALRNLILRDVPQTLVMAIVDMALTEDRTPTAQAERLLREALTRHGRWPYVDPLRGEPTTDQQVVDHDLAADPSRPSPSRPDPSLISRQHKSPRQLALESRPAGAPTQPPQREGGCCVQHTDPRSPRDSDERPGRDIRRPACYCGRNKETPAPPGLATRKGAGARSY